MATLPTAHRQDMQCKDGEGGGRAVACSRTIYTSSDGQTHASCTFGHCHDARAHSKVRDAAHATAQTKSQRTARRLLPMLASRERMPQHAGARRAARPAWKRAARSRRSHPASSSSRASSGKSSIKIIRRVGEEGHDVGRSRQDGGRRVGGGQQASEAGEAWRRLEGMAGRREARLGWEATMCKFTPTGCHWG